MLLSVGYPSWLRSHGVTAHIVFTVDNGEEFGGKSSLKIRELRKLISGFGCRFIQNRKVILKKMLTWNALIVPMMMSFTNFELYISL